MKNYTVLRNDVGLFVFVLSAYQRSTGHSSLCPSKSIRKNILVSRTSEVWLTGKVFPSITSKLRDERLLQCLLAVAEDIVVGYACLNPWSEERCFAQ